MTSLKSEAAQDLPYALRIPDAVRYAGLSRSTLYKLESAGKLQMVRVAGRTLVLRTDLERLIGSAGAAE